MDVATPTFSMTEVEEILRSKGFSRGTETFNSEVNRRFRPSDTTAGQYVERDDWQERQSSALFDAVMNGEIDPKQVQPRRYADSRFDVV